MHREASYVHRRLRGDHLKIDPLHAQEAAKAASCTFWGGHFTWGFPVEALDILAPFLVVGVGLLAWRVQAWVLKRRTAFDYITTLLASDWLEIHRKAIVELKKRPRKSDWTGTAKRWDALALDEEDGKVIGAVFPLLNQLEFAAIGLRFWTRTMDRRFYARAFGIGFIQAWERAEPLIEAMRETDRGRPLFRNFDIVARSRSFRRMARWKPEYSVTHSRGQS